MTTNVIRLPSRKAVRSTSRSQYKAYLRAVTSIHGEAIMNPFKELRLKSDSTMEEVASSMSLSKQALIRTEQGCYPEPPDRVIMYWAEVLGTPGAYVDLARKYHVFINSTRDRHNTPFGDQISPELFSVNEHPFRTLLKLWSDPVTGMTYEQPMNVTECAKIMCIQQSVLDVFLNKPQRHVGVPMELQDALSDAGYIGDEVRCFETAFIKFRDSLPVGLVK